MTASPRKGPRPQASRSRFHEGSMNDRVSAVPPVQFLGPEEREALERPAEVEHHIHLRLHRPQSQHSPPQPRSQSQSQPQPQPQHQKQGSIGRKGGNLLGQVWEGVRGKLRLRRDAGSHSDEDTTTTTNNTNTKKKAVETKRPEIERPTREETLANYQNLVASGFFTQHAIQSTRHARPGTSYQTPCRDRPPSSHSLPQHPSYPPPPPPQWPLCTSHLSPSPLTPNAKRHSSPFLTPASASSRGTKRAADEDEIRIHEDNDATPVRSSTPHAKLRKIASGNFVSLPKLPTPRNKLLTARRIPSSASMRNGGLPPVIVQQREPSKTTKRLPPPVSPASSTSSSARSSLESLSERMYSTVRRNVSENYYSVRAVGSGSMTARILRPRSSAQGLRVMPDANRGIPRVPLIPSKFAAAGYGEDRENNQIWRSLRR
ncbi:hypothetical protein PT974_00234 [Cladobotryum mycophilum]|uniref:Uncharacterized protein n=1 Tax=Cladobotryum mycophilum TaxID=491253 RepID=A0ABR0T0H3_9HYPO